MAIILAAVAVAMLLESAVHSVAVGQEGSAAAVRASGGSAERGTQRAEIVALIERMGRSGADNQQVREEARAELQSIGKAAVPYVTAALRDGQWNRRMSAALLLTKLKPRESTQALIEVMYRSTPRGKQAPWWMQEFLKQCGRAFRGITGRQFWYEPDDANASNAVGKMLDWWSRNWKQYPEQVSTVAPSRPESEEDAAARGKTGGVQAEEFDPSEEIRKLAPVRYPDPYAGGIGR
jgi:hypothetical protein